MQEQLHILPLHAFGMLNLCQTVSQQLAKPQKSWHTLQLTRRPHVLGNNEDGGLGSNARKTSQHRIALNILPMQPRTLCLNLSCPQHACHVSRACWFLWGPRACLPN